MVEISQKSHPLQQNLYDTLSGKESYGFNVRLVISAKRVSTSFHQIKFFFKMKMHNLYSTGQHTTEEH